MSSIPPDLAEKVIGADLRNLVKKVSEGSTLSQPEREMMERSVIDGTLPAELQESRLAALARAYALGKSLSKSQEKELSILLPVGKPIARRLTATSYRYKLAHYVQAIGLTGKDPERKLKRWIATGRKQSPPDLPPFDNLPLMPEWWRRNMEWRVPDFLLRFEHGDTTSSAPAGPEDSPVPASAAAPAAMAPATGEVLGVPMLIDMNSDMSADIGLNQIRSLVSSLFDRMSTCFASGHITQATNYQREWKKLIDTQRQWEKDIVKIQEGKGEVLRARVINVELGRVFNVMSQSFMNVLQSQLDKHASQLPGEERRQLAVAARDKCFAHLKSTRFAAVYQPEAA
jgi:hypothetical protein